MNQLRFRTRLVLILSLFAIVPALVLTLLWSGTVSTVLPFVTGQAAWDSVAASGERAIAAARQAPLTASQRRAVDAHERELRTSVEQARRYSFLAERTVRLLALAGVLALLILAGAASRVAGHLSPLWTRAASGAILISGGLAALAWLPHANVIWTVPPQIFIGAGLGLALSALTQRALAGRSGQALHGGWTIAARHAGIVLGLVLLTPIFTADLDRNEHEALSAGTSAVLDSRISPLDKIGVARDVLVAVDKAKADGRIPDVREVVGHRDDSAYADLGNALQDQLDRAVTNAFSNSFLVSALLGLLALVPIVLGRREVGV